MELQKISLRDRLYAARDNHTVQPEYQPALIRQWADIPIQSYFRDHPEAMQRLFELLHLHQEADPTYGEVAGMIFDRVYAGGELDAEETKLLAIPLQEAWARQKKP